MLVGGRGVRSLLAPVQGPRGLAGLSRRACLPKSSLSMSIPYLDGYSDAHQRLPEYQVIFMRHGESTWNRDNRFIGWNDEPCLTERGEEEALEAALTLKEFGVEVDEIFCSYLKRAIKTSWLITEGLDKQYTPVTCDWRLNEQMYGWLQGRNKREMASTFGVELVHQWRRSYDRAPPAVPGGKGYFPPGDPRYLSLTDEDIPDSWCGSAQTESLKDAQTRAWAMWKQVLAPKIKSGKKILIVGHGNVIRAMLKRLDSLPTEFLMQLSIPRATPLIFDLDADLRPVPSPLSLGPLSGRFLGSPLQIAKKLREETTQAQLGRKPDDGGERLSDPGAVRS
jgi:2,3-bisphosphoglycerate-dependent phosphoglycerate mutase